MDHKDNEDKQQRMAIEYMKQIIKDKLNQKYTEHTKRLNLLYEEALMNMDAIDLDKLTNDDINSIVHDIMDTNLATS